MKKIASFENSMNVLIRAYMNDTLVHGSCAACAVGNIIAEACKYKYSEPSKNRYGEISLFYTGGIMPFWVNRFQTFEGEQRFFTDGAFLKEADDQIARTGYTMGQLARIEFAFETAPKGNNADDYMFNGLLAVCDVLADIHGIDLTVKNEFVKQLETVYNS